MKGFFPRFASFARALLRPNSTRILLFLRHTLAPRSPS